MEKFTRIAITVADLALSLLFPIWDPHEKLRPRVRNATLLIFNVSFILEPIFRIKLLLLQDRWLRDPHHIAYETARRNLSALVKSRSNLGRQLIPSHGIKTHMFSIGLFSAGLDLMGSDVQKSKVINARELFKQASYSLRKLEGPRLLRHLALHFKPSLPAEEGARF